MVSRASALRSLNREIQASYLPICSSALVASHLLLVQYHRHHQIRKLAVSLKLDVPNESEVRCSIPISQNRVVGAQTVPTSELKRSSCGKNTFFRMILTF
jgi:hypothetical protein